MQLVFRWVLWVFRIQAESRVIPEIHDGCAACSTWKFLRDGGGGGRVGLTGHASLFLRRSTVAFCAAVRCPKFLEGLRSERPNLSIFSIDPACESLKTPEIMFASGHTAENTPDLFRTLKLTAVGPG